MRWKPEALLVLLAGTLWLGPSASAQNVYIPTIISAPGPIRPVSGFLTALGSSAFNQPVARVSVPFTGPLGPIGPFTGPSVSPQALAIPGLVTSITPIDPLLRSVQLGYSPTGTLTDLDL